MAEAALPHEPNCKSCELRKDAPSPAPTRVLIVGSGRAAIQGLEKEVAEAGGIVEQVPDAGAAWRCLYCSHWDVVAPIIGEPGDGADEVGWWTDALRDLKNAPRLVPLTRNLPSPDKMHAAILGIPEGRPKPAAGKQDLDGVTERVVREAEDVVPLPVVRPITIGQSEFVVDDPAMLLIYRTITRVAPSSATVLLTGATGTGKELAARTVHQLSPRAHGPFVAVNCAAIPANLIESELFGHERGSFSGAVSKQIGRWERAHGGTLFLDEIGDLELHLQGKILRAIQEREIERVGSAHPTPVDVRIVAATNQDLRHATTDGRFREDLYYRLAVVSIHLPRLVDRSDDLLSLSAHYLRQLAEQNGKQVVGITAEALARLRQHSWPGNIRELQNVLEHGMLLMTGDTFRVEHLPEYLKQSRAVELVPTADSPTHYPSLAEVEARHIGEVLRHSGGQLAAAAVILGIHRNTLRRKIQEHHLA